MTRSERRQRDRKVAADRARGMTWPQLAERHDLSERQARRVVEAWWAERPAAEELDPERIVRETLDAFAQDLGDLAVLSVETRNDGVRLGAIKARGDVFRSRVEVLRTLNALPADWQGWMQHNDARRLLERFMKTLDARDDVPADLLAELDAVLRSDSPQAIADSYPPAARKYFPTSPDRRST